MIHRVLLPVLLITIFSGSVARADDDLVRLPGQGELKPAIDGHTANLPTRLAPGGGLLMSFDANSDGLISTTEIEFGIIEAFLLADANADGNLTPLEQAAWANELPTRDDTLNNPVRFDPNLDRYVSLEEFTGAVQQMVLIYADEATGDVSLAALEVRSEKEDDRRVDETPQNRRGGAAPGNRRGGSGKRSFISPFARN